MNLYLSDQHIAKIVSQELRSEKMAPRKVQVEVGCRVKHFVCMITVVIVITVITGLGFHYGGPSSEVAGTDLDPPNVTIIIGGHVAPTRPRRDSPTEEELFDKYWVTYSSDEKTIPNSTSYRNNTLGGDLQNWDMTTPSLFMMIMSGVAILLMLAIGVMLCILCKHHSHLARLKKQREVTTPNSWMIDESFDYTAMLARGHEYRTSKHDRTPSRARDRRVTVREELRIQPGRPSREFRGAEDEEALRGDLENQESGRGINRLDSLPCVEQLALIQNSGLPGERIDHDHEQEGVQGTVHPATHLQGAVNQGLVATPFEKAAVGLVGAAEVRGDAHHRPRFDGLGQAGFVGAVHRARLERIDDHHLGNLEGAAESLEGTVHIRPLLDSLAQGGLGEADHQVQPERVGEHHPGGLGGGRQGPQLEHHQLRHVQPFLYQPT